MPMKLLKSELKTCSHPPGLRSELEQLRSRLENTDQELQVSPALKSPLLPTHHHHHPLQRTNVTLRRLGDEMRSYSQEKSRQREEELRIEVIIVSVIVIDTGMRMKMIMM